MILGADILLAFAVFFVPKNSLLPEWVRKVLESVILRFLISVKRLEKSPETDWFQDFSGCGGRTRTYGLRVMRQSQAQIGVISAPICAFCRRSLGGFSIVSVQPYPFQFHSGSKLGQDRFTGNFQSRNVIYQCIPHRGDVDCTISVDIEIPGVLNDTPRNCFVLCLSFVGKLRY